MYIHIFTCAINMVLVYMMCNLCENGQNFYNYSICMNRDGLNESIHLCLYFCESSWSYRKEM